MKQDADDLIKALEDILAVAPDGAALRLYLGNQAEAAPMSPEQFIAFTLELLDVAKKIRKKYD
jgi:hypothetical protein